MRSRHEKIKKMKTLGIFGTSGFAREVNDIATDIGYRTVYISRDKAELDVFNSVSEVIPECDVGKYRDMNYVIGVGENAVRQKVAQRFEADLNFVNLIHPSATFGRGQHEVIASAKGVIICAGARLTNNVRVGNFTIFNLNSTIGHDTIIEDFVNVSPGANISGNVYVGKHCWIGTGAIVNQGTGSRKLTIGDNTMIGSGSVVIKDCEPNAVYVGIPAKRIK